MAHLMKLEMKKFRLLHNILFTLAAVLFSILFITVSLVDSMTDPSQTKDSFESTFLVIGLLMSFIFLVYSSILTSRLVIREYEQKTITHQQTGHYHGLYGNIHDCGVYLLQRLYYPG